MSHAAGVSQVRTLIVAVSGFESRVGKTALVCRLLRAFPGWEAIKLTRGHRHSWGNDALAGRVPQIRSGRESNYAPGKDTGRFWDAGAVNVQWVIASDSQVEEGMRLAIENVRARGVVVEGTSFLRFMDVDFAVMVTRAEGGKIKPTARRALRKCDALFLTGEPDATAAHRSFAKWRAHLYEDDPIFGLPVYAQAEFPRLLEQIRRKLESRS